MLVPHRFQEQATQARYEHEAAVLDLSEAAQAAAQASVRAARGRTDEVEHLCELARGLYESAARHRERARHLERTTRAPDGDEG